MQSYGKGTLVCALSSVQYIQFLSDVLSRGTLPERAVYVLLPFYLVIKLLPIWQQQTGHEQFENLLLRLLLRFFAHGSCLRSVTRVPLQLGMVLVSRCCVSLWFVFLRACRKMVCCVYAVTATTFPCRRGTPEFLWTRCEGGWFVRFGCGSYITGNLLRTLARTGRSRRWGQQHVPLPNDLHVLRC